MLYHHDARDYEAAASEAAAYARSKLEALIERGRAGAGEVIEQVATQRPRDRIAPAPELGFEPIADGLAIRVAGGAPERVHRHARGQMAYRAGVPVRYLDRLVGEGEWGRELAAHTLGTIFGNADADSRFLLRDVGGEVRGFLSDRYRRLDSRPIVDAFARTCQEAGMVPVEGYALDTKIAIKALVPQIFEPAPNEVTAFGVILENSDFGNGALSLRTFMLRLWCTNYGIMNEDLRQVHLGKRLDDSVEWSDKTYRLDTEASASAVADLVGELGSGKRIAQICGAIAAAAAQEVDPGRISARLGKRLGKDELRQVKETFELSDDAVEVVPPGKTLWRLSNAVSWVAGQAKDRERSLELQKIAGELVAA